MIDHILIAGNTRTKTGRSRELQLSSGDPGLDK
jgi:hypothetical protein